MDPVDVAETVTRNMTGPAIIAWPVYEDETKPPGYRVRLKFATKTGEGRRDFVIEWPFEITHELRIQHDLIVQRLRHVAFMSAKVHAPGTVAEAEELANSLLGLA